MWLGLYIFANHTWLFVFFIEGAYRIRENRLNFKKVVIAPPFLACSIGAEMDHRELGTTVPLNVNKVSDRVLFYITNVNWREAFTNTIRPIVMRLQHLASVIGIIDNANVISAELNNREFLYFFEEGHPQYTFLKLFGNAGVQDIHNTLLTYLVPYQLPFETITNTHVRLVGRFWISPKIFPLSNLCRFSFLGRYLAYKDAARKQFNDGYCLACLVGLFDERLAWSLHSIPAGSRHHDYSANVSGQIQSEDYFS